MRKDQIRALLKAIETGDPHAIAVVNQDKYIQHNPQTHEGGEGLEALFARLAKTEPRVNVVRAFEDGDFVFGHTEYDFASRKIGFEVFRFEGAQVVEHWDNIQERQGPNDAGHSMVDGPTEATDLDRTEANRALVSSFVDDFLIGGNAEAWGRVDATDFVDHAPIVGLQAKATSMRYETRHRVLAEGSFVLTACEGSRDGVHTSFYDLFRVADGSIVEHWDTIEKIAPRSEWKNNNGKF